MIDLYLKAAGEDVAKAALAGFVTPDGNWRTAGPGFALDPIGPIEVQPPALDAGGTVVASAVMDTAFHLNIRLFGAGEALAVAIAETGLVIQPQTPCRMWA